MPTIQNRRATKTQWAAANPVLAAGEIGYEIDTNKVKVGNGLTPWGDLSYFIDENEVRSIGASTFATQSQLAGQNATHLWMPPEQEAQPNLVSWTAQQFIDEYEALRASAPEYVTREQIGLDAESKPIWAYFFTPAAYENTVLTFNQHGYEKVAIHSTLSFAKLLVSSWATNPRLAAFRARTRLVIVPFVTWIGVNNTRRTNANGVDLNRNWDWKWAGDPGTTPGAETYKGPSAFSEPETQALRNFVSVLDAQGGLNAALDMHSVGYTRQEDPYYVYFGLPSPELAEDSWAAELARELAPGKSRYVAGGNLPSATSWIQSQGIRTLTVEYYQSFGEVALDKTNMTYAVRGYGNTIMRAAELPSLKSVKSKLKPIARTFDYVSGGGPNIFVPAGTSANNVATLDSFTHEFETPGAGLLVWIGQVMFGQGTVGRVWLQPVAGSDSTHSWWKAAGKSWDTQYGDLTGVDSRVVLPFVISRPITDSAGKLWPTRLSLKACGNGTTPPQILRYNATMLYIPAQGVERFERFTATGRSGVDAMQFATGL